MNKNSLAQSYIQNQQNSSMIDDAFELTSRFKGLRVVSNQQNLSDYAQELAYTFGSHNGSHFELSLIDVPEDEQGELVRLYMDSTGRETSECVHGNDFSIDNDFTCALMALMKEDCQETRDTFADITRKNILNYYANSLQIILDEACHDLLCALNNESGLYSYQDTESGETVWSQF